MPPAKPYISDCQAGFFAFAEAEQQVDDKADKGYRGNHPPQGLFAHRAEVFLRHVDNGPDGAHKKRHTQADEDYSCLNSHRWYNDLKLD